MIELHSLSRSGSDLCDYQRMVYPNRFIGRAKRNPTDGAMGGKQPVKGIARPRYAKRVAHQRQQWNFIDCEPPVNQKGIREIGVSNIEPPDFSQVLDLEKRDRRNPPRPVSFEPAKL